MGALGFILLVSALVPGAASVSGTVTGNSGQPVAGARVFLEPGLGGALSETKADPDGRFQFDSVASGLVGVFAIADGYGFGGLSGTIPVDDSLSELKISLEASGGIAGKVSDMKGEPIDGAHVTRLLIMGGSPVGIPLAKLTAYGFEEPETDGNGRFSISNLPQGATIALKVGHPKFAQAGVQGITVGDKDVRVQLSPGVLVQGNVLSRGGDRAVANATIIIRSATPPHDTSVTTTDLSGEFAIRLNPGYYLYQAAGQELRSPGWEKLTVSGREPGKRVTLRVAGTAKLTGDVRDAVTGEPIAGARLALAAFGSPVAVVTTGPSGAYAFTGVEGANEIRLEPVSGYAPPDKPYLSVQEATQGETLALPTFWLRPLPAHRIQVVDESGAPVPGALIHLIRPVQYGVYVTDAKGWADFEVASAPENGTIIGLAEHPKQPLAALFTTEATALESARVKLFPVGTVTGTIVNAKGKPIEGAVVGGLFQSDDDDEPLQLWRTVSGPDGNFSWKAVIPFVPMACLAATGPDGFGRSMPFNLKAGGAQSVGNVVISEPGDAAKKGKEQTLQGKRLDWSNYPVLSGSPPAVASGNPAVILYATAVEAPRYLRLLKDAGSALEGSGAAFILVADGPVSLDGGFVPILQGVAPGSAQTYVVDGNGTVSLETWGLPPVSSLVGGKQGA